MQYIDDKAVLGEVIGQLVPPPATDEGLRLLTKWTKRNHTLHPDYDQPMWRVPLGDDQYVQAVTRPRSAGGGTALIFYQVVEQQSILDEDGNQKRWPDGKPMVSNVLEFSGMRPCRDAREAADLIDQIRAAHEAVVGRDVDGFGAAVEPADEPDDDIAGFGPES